MRRALLLLAVAVVLLAPDVEAQQLILAWDPSPSVETVWYRVYANGAVVRDLPVSATSTVIEVKYNTDYEFHLTSLDITGLEGPVSNSAFGRVAAPALSVTCPTVAPIFVSSVPVIVAYNPPVASGGVSPIQLSCAPPSGSSFTAGSTTVSCSAQDAVPQTAACSFAVSVTYVPPPPPPDTTIPIISSLTVGRRTGNNFPVTVIATDDVEVDRVEFFLDNGTQPVVRLDAPTTLPSTWSARVTIKASGTHTIRARAYDTTGNASAWAAVTVRR